ncbi:hypothetical protein [Kribbella shirazensis]|uniref:Transcriptional regulator, AbiEi antitoxin, Type IV TA system n=1 Tax=Kribbella shirazensis TaxID=1105143 RepID=A0A7X5VFH4_9ACTN|nr:hypothetical protein [Kribbella shirazensis]NIK60285.1 hypothetical protein [Kribbella shirazensis]
MRHAELLELGLRKFEIERLVRRGHLQHAHGRYVAGSLDRRIAVIACAQSAHPRSVISHFSAAELTGLRVWSDRDARPSADVWLTCEPGPRRNLRRADVVLRRAGLTETDLDLRHGLWITSAARTTVDIARELPFREAVVTVDHALARSVSRSELDAVLARQYQWPGVAKARAVVAFADPRAESALESYARATFAERGLPSAILQAQFWDGDHWLTDRVDLWWPEFRTIGEADGLEKFEAPTASERRWRLRRAFERDQRLADRGLELVHFGWEDAVLRPDALVQRFRAAFQRGSRRTDPAPTWRTAA